MTNDNRLVLSAEIDYRMDRLLEEWWQYARDYRGGPADAHASSIYASARSRGNGGSAEEMLADSVDHITMESVDSSVASLPRDHQHAIEVRMLNALTRTAVWRSNRLGKQADALYVEAKVMLLPMLRRRRVEI